LRDHVESLCERGLAFPELFDEIEAFRETVDTPACAVSFQLPYPLAIEFSDYIGRGNRSDIDIHLRFIPCVSAFDKRMRRTIHKKGSANPHNADNKLIECTQCIAIMPPWGTRRQYYFKYCDLSGRGRESDVVIPRENKPFTYNLSGAITVRMFELELSKRAIAESAGAVRRFLRDYMAISLHEVAIPELLYSTMASPRDERYFPLGDSPDLLIGLLPEGKNRALRPASREGVERAARWPARAFSPFEGQILALKRLSDEGEPELALVGLMALVEWLIKCNLPEHLLHPDKRKNGAAHLARQAEKCFPVAEGVWRTLNSARMLRNDHVHERPTSRSQSYDPALPRYSNSSSSKAFDAAALAACELFRAINSSQRTEAAQNTDAG
jgi:hypothetical protein